MNLGTLLVLASAIVGVVACNQTKLSDASAAKGAFIRTAAGYELQDCAVDAGTCKAGQVRALATSIDCAAASLLADGHRPGGDGGVACVKAAP